MRINLDGSWHYRADLTDAGIASRWFDQPRPHQDWNDTQVPGGWGRAPKEALTGYVWLRRGIQLPSAPDRPWRVCACAVPKGTRVWLNGREIAEVLRVGKRALFDAAPAAREGSNDLVLRLQPVENQDRLIGSIWIQPDAEPAVLLGGEFHDRTARRSSDWVRDAVIYEAYPRSSSQEGTFDGLRRRLGELQNLGVTTLWLMPIHPIGRKHRKGRLGCPYAVRDFYDVNPEFGTIDDFRALLADAHDRGMKLIIDLVANHTAWDCPLIAQHPDWYERDGTGQFRCPVPDWSDTAQLDYQNPAVREYMAEVMLYWVDDVGIDGFRCDVAGMVPLDFWEDMRPRLDAVRPVMMLAEDDQPAQHLQAFDLTYDWATYGALGALSPGRLRPVDLSAVLSEERLDFPQGSLRMRFSSNHDLCAWHRPAPVRYGDNATKTAAVITYALPGVPLIYTGQEVGSTARLDLFEKVPVDWESDKLGMRTFYEQIGRLRQERVSLRRGKAHILDVGDGTWGIARESDDQATYVLINLRREPVSVPLKVNAGNAIDELMSSTAAASSAEEVTLPGLGFWIGGT